MRIELEGLRRKLKTDAKALWADENSRDLLRGALRVFLAVHTEAILDQFDGPHNAMSPKVRLEPNDWFDLGQLRYVQAGSVWVTGEKRWPEIGKRAGVGQHVLLASR